MNLLRHVYKKAKRESKGLGITLVLEETTDPHIIAERAQRDLKIFPEIKEICRGRLQGTVYTPGVRLPSQAPLDPLTRNQYLSRLFPLINLDGIVEDNPELRSGGEEVIMSLLEESIPLFAEKTELAGIGSGEKK